MIVDSNEIIGDIGLEVPPIFFQFFCIFTGDNIVFKKFRLPMFINLFAITTLKNFPSWNLSYLTHSTMLVSCRF